MQPQAAKRDSIGDQGDHCSILIRRLAQAPLFVPIRSAIDLPKKQFVELGLQRLLQACGIHRACRVYRHSSIPKLAGLEACRWSNGQQLSGRCVSPHVRGERYFQSQSSRYQPGEPGEDRCPTRGVCMCGDTLRSLPSSSHGRLVGNPSAPEGQDTGSEVRARILFRVPHPVWSFPSLQPHLSVGQECAASCRPQKVQRQKR